MKKIKILITVISILLIPLFAYESLAQRGIKWKGSEGWGPGSRYDRMYDPKTIEAISGVVGGVYKRPDSLFPGM